ncbi:GNAT family N-acetyltransferase [Nostoc sp. TCL26-01]|uniref:GNAT family N-acetyltransferase n=1 Tax=Nostoc sp. TCL26-01 TaxID=2576904 RepID=UPI0015C1291A|nr:GNAT family N-acetyltransferase [Nostoc sp. TCL26-01]QLE59137.1 GNAT family N-acetyltransferase [Nostoc sp. TCL26-01]
MKNQKTFHRFIQGARVFLREVRQSDVNETYYQWLNDPEINRYLETRFVHRSLDNISEYVKIMDAKEDEPFFAICLNDNQEHIGNIKLGPINCHHRNADVSLFIGKKELWGQGYAAEAIALVTEFAFKKLNLNKLKAGCYAMNLASAKAFIKCGYQQEGLLRGQVIVDAQDMDVILLGMRAVDFWNSK